MIPLGLRGNLSNNTVAQKVLSWCGQITSSTSHHFERTLNICTYTQCLNKKFTLSIFVITFSTVNQFK